MSRAVIVRWALAGCVVVVSGMAGVPATADSEGRRPAAPVVTVEAASVSWDTGRPAGGAGPEYLSDDGERVLFFSDSSDLIPRPPRFGYHLYVRDVVAETTQIVTARSDGTPAPGSSFNGMGFSGDGRFAAFGWNNPRLSPTGSDPAEYVFVKDLDTGHLDAIRGEGAGVTAGSRPVHIKVDEISRNGRYVSGSGAFVGESVSGSVAFLLDRRTDRWRWVCPPGGQCRSEALSDNGRYLVHSRGATGGAPSYWRYDRRTGTSTPVPRGPISDLSVMGLTVFSGNGRLMVVNWEDNYTGESTVLLYRTRDMTILKELSPDALMLVKGISHSGRYMVLTANPDGFRWFQTYRWDRATDTYTLVTRNTDGEPGNFRSSGRGISADGDTVLFNTGANNLVTGDQRGRDDPSYYDSFVAHIRP